MTVLGPLPAVDEWILMPSTLAAESARAQERVSSGAVCRRMGPIISVRSAGRARDTIKYGLSSCAIERGTATASAGSSADPGIHRRAGPHQRAGGALAGIRVALAN